MGDFQVRTGHDGQEINDRWPYMNYVSKEFTKAHQYTLSGLAKKHSEKVAYSLNLI